MKADRPPTARWAAAVLAAGVLSAAWGPPAAAETPPDAVASSGAGASNGASPVPAAREARIPFADHGNIYDWQVVDNKTVLIQTQEHKWYKATLMSACIELPFSEKIGFQSNPDGSFDKFSTIRVRDQTCTLVSLVETPAPAKKPKAKKNS